VAEVTMSLEEYLALTNQDGSFKAKSPADVVKIKPKRKGKPDPKMARALKKANAWGRTKSGKMRKGVTQAKIMKKAHALRRKMR